MESDILVSMVTVCYNAEKDIRKTLQSVLNQDYKNIEYIVIDGKSTDSTMNIINEYKSNESVNFKVVSENDNGIYDAMNKGIDLANGEIIYFLNVGDLLFDNQVISKAVFYFNNNRCDVLYGDIELAYKNEVKIKENSKLGNKFFLKGDAICHQCIFAKKEVFHKTGYFNINYRICADRDWLLKCFKLKLKINHVNTVIAKYDMYGFSSADERQAELRLEYDKIILEQYNFMCYLLQKLRHALGSFKRKVSSSFKCILSISKE